MLRTSLIITVYNRSHLLRKALLSLSNQSVLPDELILSDDGSDEDILKNIKDIIDKIGVPVKFVSQKKDGFRLAKCRNNGVRASSGDLLIFLDQDLIHTVDYIKTFVNNYKPGRFLTSYPIRLSEEQSDSITEERIRSKNFLELTTSQQRKKIKKQFFKDGLSTVLYYVKLENKKPKIRGGACAINRDDYYAVNGYDENFNAWGNEDDDIRRRLYKYGVGGLNPFYKEFPLHLYHEPFHSDGLRENKEYNDKRMAEIESGDYKCSYGIESPLGSEEPVVTDLVGESQ